MLCNHKYNCLSVRITSCFMWVRSGSCLSSICLFPVGWATSCAWSFMHNWGSSSCTEWQKAAATFQETKEKKVSKKRKGCQRNTQSHMTSCWSCDKDSLHKHFQRLQTREERKSNLVQLFPQWVPRGLNAPCLPRSQLDHWVLVCHWHPATVTYSTMWATRGETFYILLISHSSWSNKKDKPEMFLKGK